MEAKTKITYSIKDDLQWFKKEYPNYGLQICGSSEYQHGYKVNIYNLLNTCIASEIIGTMEFDQLRSTIKKLIKMSDKFKIIDEQYGLKEATETRKQEARDIELKRCPFCGSDEIVLEPDLESYPTEWYAGCCGCDACSGNFIDPVESVNKWNGRVIIIFRSTK